MHESMDSERRLRRREQFLTLHVLAKEFCSRAVLTFVHLRNPMDGREIKSVEKNPSESEI